MINFTIIIPHKGPQELLDRCVASIPKRDDLQTIIINDEDGRGAGWARNEGLKLAVGKYVIFSDSDDFFHPCFNDFLDSIINDNTDVIYFNADSIELENSEPSWRANHLNHIMASNDMIWQERHLRYHFTEPWCKAINLSFIQSHSIKFSESKILNDIYFSTQIGIYAKTIKVYKEKCYCIRNHKGSTAKLKSDDRMIDYTRETAKSNMLLKKYGIKHQHSRMLRPFFSALLHIKPKLALQCWNVMREEGYKIATLMVIIARYPYDFVKLIIRKIIAKEIL